ncbi:ferredoxin reductase [Rhodococcus sp. BP-252]|uniref:ferredoxin reductase n=1 Tax=unclassified Rhodococcus (in: high G+C Gram-positive bacteria) TaxID=192944 RepID=UPI001C9B92A1|nr:MULTISPECIES: ferredoxin reductase [unclassified Rhodococcus (in: high G+C Gram-positive bacteria)]MBY6414595.1 ferredoxin reductase [Rhodococcus sp. BP-320]MBY6419352.1 ferredoxin reductase [Rhodococcus sp. BP-321]MBY6424334.1 ferredoxin reductase [Rhodococcus sp. BP-324]MBY6429431.1 ferredoxin reductase [Rhodococcus sp. BP-323]MBY6431950.1 ferredoxin reductase [Rhodococcus sp. BP-322]
MNWLVATLTDRTTETPTSTTLTFDVDGWPGHRPGQHVDVRLTAEDGYSAQRSYSMATPADGSTVVLTVQTVDDGEVSPYLADVLEVGAQVELKGPIGGWFVWDEADDAPVLLIAGGSGIVPLMAMIRARRRSGSTAPFRLIYSVRSPAEVMYASELASMQAGVEVAIRYTREDPNGHPGRLTPDAIASGGWSPDIAPRCFVCGPTGFVEMVADVLVTQGHMPFRVKTERFGPVGIAR